MDVENDVLLSGDHLHRQIFSYIANTQYLFIYPSTLVVPTLLLRNIVDTVKTDTGCLSPLT